MPSLAVDGLTFAFPDGWQISKYDDWSFYRNRFSRFLRGCKAIDLIAVSPNGTVFLIEAKDYRVYRRTKTIKLADEVTKKVLDTLAAILPCKVNGDDDNENTLPIKYCMLMG